MQHWKIYIKLASIYVAPNNKAKAISILERGKEITENGDIISMLDELYSENTINISGSTAKGLWNGIISDVCTYENGDVITRTGCIENGMCNESDPFNQPDNSYRSSANEYIATDPIRGAIFSILTDSNIDYSIRCIVKTQI